MEKTLGLRIDDLISVFSEFELNQEKYDFR